MHLNYWYLRRLRRIRRLLQAERRWTIMLVTDAETRGNGASLTENGWDQVTECARRINQIVAEPPLVWAAAPWDMQLTTAAVLNGRLRSPQPVHDWSVGAHYAYCEAAGGDLTRLIEELEQQHPDRPVVLVLVNAFGGLLLRRAGIPATMEPSLRRDRPYTLTVTSRGVVMTSPLQDLTPEVDDLAGR